MARSSRRLGAAAAAARRRATGKQNKRWASDFRCVEWHAHLTAWEPPLRGVVPARGRGARSARGRAAPGPPACPGGAPTSVPASGPGRSPGAGAGGAGAAAVPERQRDRSSRSIWNPTGSPQGGKRVGSSTACQGDRAGRGCRRMSRALPCGSRSRLGRLRAQGSRVWGAPRAPGRLGRQLHPAASPSWRGCSTPTRSSTPPAATSVPVGRAPAPAPQRWRRRRARPRRQRRC